MAVMMVLMVELVLMMIPMMPGMMVMTMTAIPPLREGNSPADFSLPELFFSLSGFRLVEAVEKLFVDTPDVFKSKGSNTPKGSRRGGTGTRGGSHPRPGVDPRQGVDLPPGDPLHAPFSSVTYPSKY